MRRRDFITLLSGATVPLALQPFATHAQQRAAPVVGYLHQSTPEATIKSVAAFRKGLSEAGFVDGRNLAIEYRWANNEIDRLPELAADLVRRGVAVIATPGSTPAALAAKAATTTIPIVFGVGGDPVLSGLVASLNRPGGNLTGTNSMTTELATKQVALLHEFVPRATRFAMLVNPGNPTNGPLLLDAQTAASILRLQIEIVPVANPRDIAATFADLVQRQFEAVFVPAEPVFASRRGQLALLAARHAVPVMYGDRQYAEAGGLMSYGSNLQELYRLTGMYAGRVLKGEKPADLPVMRAVKFEFIINLQAASVLGIDVPATLLAQADEVIE